MHKQIYLQCVSLIAWLFCLQINDLANHFWVNSENPAVITLFMKNKVTVSPLGKPCLSNARAIAATICEQYTGFIF